MSQNNPVILHVGLDVAKLSLQLHLAGQPQALTNDPTGHAQLLKLLSPHPHAHVICEATGGYEQPVVQVLQTAGIPISVIAPSRVRYYARAHNLRAKTDPIDAALLARFGAEIKPAPTPGVSVPQKRLADLCQRRRQLIDTRTMEHNRSEHYTDPFCVRQARQLLKTLEKQITACDQTIAQLIAEDAELAYKASRLDALAGVGPVVAATMLADMPELGKLNDQTAAALAGVAPYNNGSGPKDGRRHIYGGRRSTRCALYMATLSAVRHDPILKEFYLRLRAKGKPPLVALTACMRKLIILMNRLLKNPNFSLAH